MGEESGNSGAISQDDIDSLLDEVEKDGSKGAEAPKESSKEEKKEEKKEGPAEPEVDLKAWGLDEKMKPLDSQSDAGATPAPAPTLKTPPAQKKPRLPDEVKDLEFLMDIPLRVSAEVGRTDMTIGELLTLGPGSVVELDKLAGEPLEVYINQKLVARGEAVIVNEKFGIRLTDVVSKMKRIENLKP